MNIKRNIIRTAAAALSTGLLFAATASQAADINNRELGHFAHSTQTTASVQVDVTVTGLSNAQFGHFAAKVGSNDSASIHSVTSDTRYSLR